jgi:hypothetical protein
LISSRLATVEMTKPRSQRRVRRHPRHLKRKNPKKSPSRKGLQSRRLLETTRDLNTMSKYSYLLHKKSHIQERMSRRLVCSLPKFFCKYTHGCL